MERRRENPSRTEDPRRHRVEAERRAAAAEERTDRFGLIQGAHFTLKRWVMKKDEEKRLVASRAAERWLKRLLELIHACSKRGDFSTDEFLVKKLGASARTVRRAIRDGITLGVIKRRRAWNRGLHSRGRLPNVYEIDWERLRQFAFTGQVVRQSGQVGQSSGQVGRLNRYISARAQLPLLFPEDDSPTPTKPPPLQEPIRNVGGWEEVEQMLESKSVGMNASAACSRLAQKRGYTPSEVASIIEHYRAHPGKWGPGGIYHRIENRGPGHDVSDGWPQASAVYQRAHDVKLLEQRQQSERALEAERQRRVGETLAMLEAIYGPTVDAMTTEQRRDMLPPGPIASMPDSALARSFLLDELKRREPDP